MKNTEKLSFQGLLAGASTAASALAHKAQLAARLLRQTNATSGMLETSGHAGLYGLLLPARPKDA